MLPNSSSPGPRCSGTACTCREKSSSLWRVLRSVGPGPIALTRTRGASACAIVRVAVHSALFESV